MGFGSTANDWGALFALAFASHPLSVMLARRGDSRTHYAKGKRSRRKATLPQLVDARFQVCFTPLAAVLFAFPSRYLFTIGHRVVFSLGGWSPRIQTEFHVLRPTWDARGSGRDFG